MDRLKQLQDQSKVWWGKLDFTIDPDEIDIINSEINTLNLRIAAERQRQNVTRRQIVVTIEISGGER